MLNLVVTVLCSIGAVSVMGFITYSIVEYTSARKAERKKRQDSLDEINRNLEHIIHKLQ